MPSAPGLFLFGTIQCLEQFTLGRTRGYLGYRFPCRDGACPVLPASSHSRWETREAASLREINDLLRRWFYDTSAARVFDLTSSLRIIASAISRIALRF